MVKMKNVGLNINHTCTGNWDFDMRFKLREKVNDET